MLWQLSTGKYYHSRDEERIFEQDIVYSGDVLDTTALIQEECNRYLSTSIAA